GPTSVTLGGTVNLLAGLDQLFINTFDGNDSITLNLTSPTLAKTISAGNGSDIVNVSGSVDATIFGGAGDDLLIGSPNFDYIDGGDGDDIITGGAGDDELLGNTGSDTFTWLTGDGSDRIEGGAGESDAVDVQSNVAPDVFRLSQGDFGETTRLYINYSVGPARLNVAGVEEVSLTGANGADTFIVDDLYLTDVRNVNLFLSPTPDGTDSVTVNGRDVADQVSIQTFAPGIMEITGLRYDVKVSDIGLADKDNFTFNGNGGNDLVTTADDLSAMFTSSSVLANNTFTINGGAGDDVLSSFGRLIGGDGNDTLTGLTSPTLTNFSQILDGGNGNDVINAGTGLDSLLGGAGDDTFIPGFDLQNDTIDGGAGFDTILVQGTPGNDRIDLLQDSPTQLRYNVQGINAGTGVVGGAGTETDVLVSGTVEEVKVLAGAGDDQIRVTQSDSLIAGGQQALSLRFTIDAGQPGASDRLTVSDQGLGDTTIQRLGTAAGTGSYQIGALAPIVYYDVEYTSLISTDANQTVVPLNPITGGYGTDGQGRLFVFRPDPYESNNTLANATYLGTGPVVNVDPTIDPGFDATFGAAGDEDWYRIVAQTTGDLDIRVFFKQQGPLTNGRAGLPGNGNLDIALYDIDGIVTGFPTGGAIAGVGTFGSNESAVNDTDERIRIPAVAGQTYYLRVRGAPTAGALTNANGATASNSAALNVYNVSVINTAVVVPYAGEVDDIIANSAVTAVVDASHFSGGATLSTLDDFYNGKDVYFTNGPLNGQRGRVVDYTGATHTFTFAPFTFTTAPVVGETFQIESFDTGRSQLDNITRDNTPIIRFRLDDALLLHDVPGNPVGGNQLDAGQGPIVIPFSGNGAAQRETTSTSGVAAGFRVAIFDEGTPQQPGQLPQVPIGYARQIAEGVYEFDFERDRIVSGAVTPYPLIDGSHFLSAKVQIVDPSSPNADGFGDRSQTLEVVVDTQIPPVFFGLPNVPDDGLLPDSDTGVNANPETLNDRVTSDTTPGFFGQAEADAVIRLFVDLNADGTTNPDGTGDGIFEPSVDFQVGFTTAQPYDGTNQY
ncbi:MAG: hypothetical protein JF612_01270, partial [Planctomycetia bacterium]|nr:hypothetical protein [Planctomycetia bacterium]